MKAVANLLWVLVAVVALSGCGKKDSAPVPTPPPSEIQVTEDLPLTRTELADQVEYVYQSELCKVAVYGDVTEEAPTQLDKGVYQISKINFKENNDQNVFAQFGLEGKRFAYILCSHPEDEDKRLTTVKAINDQFKGKLRIK